MIWNKVITRVILFCVDVIGHNQEIMLELLNIFGVSNSPDLPIEFNIDEHGIVSPCDSDDSSSSSHLSSLTDKTDTSETHSNQSADDDLVSFKKVEVVVFYVNL